MKDNRIFSIGAYTLLVLFLLAMQSIQLFSIGGIYPDFIMILTIIFALSRGSFFGEIFGFFVGFALDLMSGSLFGLNAFIFTLLGSFVTLFQKAVKVSSIIVYVLYLIFATIIKYLLYAIFSSLYQGTKLFDVYFIFKIPGEILINIFIGLFLYIFIARCDPRDNYEWF